MGLLCCTVPEAWGGSKTAVDHWIKKMGADRYWSVNENGFNLILQGGLMNPGVGPTISVPLEYLVEKYADIATAMGEDTRGMNPVQAADRAIDAVIRLAKDCGIPEHWGHVTEYPKTRMGKGFYEGKTTGAIQSDDEELQNRRTNAVSASSP